MRDALLQANDPHELLINHIVEIVDPENTISFTQRIDMLEKYINILTSAHEKMLERMHTKVKQFFPHTGEQLNEICQLVENKSSDIRLRSFARDLSQSQEFGVKWLESLIAVVIGRGLPNWTENILLSAEQRISEFAQNFFRVVKSSNLGVQSQTIIGYRNISLIWENEKGEMETHSKEVIFNDELDKQSYKAILNKELASLNEFEKIEILKEMLQEALS